MPNTTAQEIYYFLFNSPPQHIRYIRQQLHHRPDFRTEFNKMTKLGQIVIEGTGKRGNPKIARLAEMETLPCPQCSGTGVIHKLKASPKEIRF